MLLWSWVAIGFFAGIIASQIPRSSGTGIFSNVIVGAVGAVAGGKLFEAWAPARAAGGVLLGRALPAGVGAALFLAAYVVISSRFGTLHA